MLLVVQSANQQYFIDSSKENIIKVDSAAKELKILFASQNNEILSPDDILTIKLKKEVIAEQVREKKVIVFKKRRRKDSMCKKGHRQNYDHLKISVV